MLMCHEILFFEWFFFPVIEKETGSELLAVICGPVGLQDMCALVGEKKKKANSLFSFSELFCLLCGGGSSHYQLCVGRQGGPVLCVSWITFFFLVSLEFSFLLSLFSSLNLRESVFAMWKGYLLPWKGWASDCSWGWSGICLILNYLIQSFWQMFRLCWLWE